MKKYLFALFSLISLLAFKSIEAKTVKVLFIGNSYTAGNNVPELVKQLALSAGDTLIYTAHTPGGNTFQQHSQNPQVINYLKAGDWDFVVLQEQSQLPSFPDNQVANMVYPYAEALNNMIKEFNPCATTLFFMTWGRKNGDAQNCPNFPPLCTYEGMDSLLQLRYTIMAEDNQAAISPVARVWREIRANHNHIVVHSSDESHASPEGSFAIAATFYAMIFEKDPVATTYNFNINANDAATIKQVASDIVFDSLTHWNRFLEDYLYADYSYEVEDFEVIFENSSLNAIDFLWDFGDGNTSTDENPNHFYSEAGIYEVSLTINNNNDCNDGKTVSYIIEIEEEEEEEDNDIAIDEIHSHQIKLYPNPTNAILNIESEINIHAYQIFDIMGRKVMDGMIKEGKHFSIDVRALNKGIYFIQLISEDEKLGVKKVVVE